MDFTCRCGPGVESVLDTCQCIGQIGKAVISVNVSLLMFILGITVEEFVSLPNRSRRARVWLGFPRQEGTEVEPLQGRFLTSDVDCLQGVRPGEGEEIAGVGFEIWIDRI